MWGPRSLTFKYSEVLNATLKSVLHEVPHYVSKKAKTQWSGLCVVCCNNQYNVRNILDRTTSRTPDSFHCVCTGYDQCILVSHDWGGIVAWVTAASYPEVVQRLIIMNAPHHKTWTNLLNTSSEQFKKSWWVLHSLSVCCREF